MKTITRAICLSALSLTLILPMYGCGGAASSGDAPTEQAESETTEEASPESKYLGTWQATKPGDEVTMTVTLELEEDGIGTYTLESTQEGTKPGVYAAEWELKGDKLKTTYTWLMEETDYLVLSEDGQHMTGEVSGYEFTKVE